MIEKIRKRVVIPGGMKKGGARTSQISLGANRKENAGPAEGEVVRIKRKKSPIVDEEKETGRMIVLGGGQKARKQKPPTPQRPESISKTRKPASGPGIF